MFTHVPDLKVEQRSVHEGQMVRMEMVRNMQKGLSNPLGVLLHGLSTKQAKQGHSEHETIQPFLPGERFRADICPENAVQTYAYNAFKKGLANAQT